MATTSQRCFSSGLPQKVRPAQPTRFDLECARLHLLPEPRAWVESTALRYWAMRNRMHRYIPEVLLKAWGLELDDYEATVA